MKVILLAGGLGTRISEETSDKPKPMVLLDDKPIIWHLMSIFAAQGFKDFVIATGYKGEIIADWVANLDTPWKIEAIDTGLNTQTGGRISQCMNKFPDDRVFATYGDGLGNIDLVKLLGFHRTHNKKATVTAVRPPARFGVLESENGLVTHFGEKNQADAGWINGGFFILEPMVSKYVFSDLEPFETGALPRLVQEGELMSYHHSGFWQPMDTLREKQELVKYVKSGIIPWLEI
ncbi:GCD1 Nucleoside-diphosphate-sugar pyrophosphorylase involved in lipopolysaccharide biosynthesis/translation initiation factor 2B, gamma/epsilon subunits (eIF-2Bgamma/eIF-2Bepsilon) [Candidatus Nanopelagicaceae bacterium]